MCQQGPNAAAAVAGLTCSPKRRPEGWLYADPPEACRIWLCPARRLAHDRAAALVEVDAACLNILRGVRKTDLRPGCDQVDGGAEYSRAREAVSIGPT